MKGTNRSSCQSLLRELKICKGGGRVRDNYFSEVCVDILGVDGEGYLVVSLELLRLLRRVRSTEELVGSTKCLGSDPRLYSRKIDPSI